MKTWFTSDTHFGHTNIIKYCKRPFANADEMDEALIENWNGRVNYDDVVWHIGDFSFSRDVEAIRKLSFKLNGKINLILGNHDHTISNKRAALKPHAFNTIYDQFHEVKVNGVNITLCHYALRVWNKSHHGAWHLYGHSHGTLEDLNDSLSFDCGVDSHNYSPVSFDEVEAIMKTKSYQPVDNHGKERVSHA
jgi:calcineurin-like phosphoesterase family protein